MGFNTIYKCIFGNIFLLMYFLETYYFISTSSMSHFTSAMFSKLSARQPNSSAQNTPSSSALEIEDLEPERKYACPHAGCLKAYRQSSGLRYHRKHVCHFSFFTFLSFWFLQRAIHPTCLLNFPSFHLCWSSRFQQKSRSCDQSKLPNRTLFNFKSAIFSFFSHSLTHIWQSSRKFISLSYVFMYPISTTRLLSLTIF